MSLRPTLLSSEQRNRRVFLRFTPIADDGAEGGKVAASLSTTTMTSNMSVAEERQRPAGADVQAVPESVANPLPTPERVGSKPNMPQTLPIPRKVKGTTDNAKSREGLRSPHGRTKRSGEHAGQSATVSLTQQEMARLEAAYGRYASFSGRETSLANLLSCITGAESAEECDVWLSQFEGFFGLSREVFGCQKSEGATGSGEASARCTEKPRRVLKYEELVRFAAWLKATHKIRIGLRPPPGCASARVVAKTADEPPGMSPLNSAREVRKLDDFRRAKGRGKCSVLSARGRRDNAPTSLSTPAEGSSQLHMPSISKRPEQTPISTTTRGYNLELQSFAELGGGRDGTGTIRLIDLKRMLQSFNIEATFSSCVGHTIDKNNTGCITFEEFLWVLEFGVRGLGPAAAIHDHLAAPITSQNVVTPPSFSERSPRLGRKGRPGGQPPSRKGRLAAAIEAIRKSFAAQSEKLSPYLTSVKPTRQTRNGRRSPSNFRRDYAKRSTSSLRGLAIRPVPVRRSPSRKKTSSNSTLNRCNGKGLHVARKGVALGS